MNNPLIFSSIIGLLVSACVTTEQVSFKPNPGQTALQREGRPAISSVGKHSVVLLGRTNRELPQGQRVGYVLAMHNRGATPLDFAVQGIEAIQTFPDRQPQPIEVLTISKLQREEQTRQVIGAILVGVAAGANAAAASRVGYYRSTSTLYTPRGAYAMQTTSYSPVAAAIARNHAAAQNAAMIDATVAQGQANLARLEGGYIKDHTLLPGEWYGGVVGIEPPTYNDPGETKTYSLTVHVGGDRHRFDIVQTPVKR